MRLLLSISAALCLSAQGPQFQPKGPQLPSPAAPSPGTSWLSDLNEWTHVRQADYETWFQEMDRWRKEYRATLAYSGAEYERPELKWAQRNFIQSQAMVEDRYLYDPVARRYTVDRYLDDVEHRYGGIDSVLIWPVYPNIGIDNRNQYDMHRDLPGGIPALRDMVERFHARGVKVFFPAMPWETGTRDEGVAGAQATARLLAAIGADGINGDTMAGVPKDYRTASDRTGHALVLEPELAPDNDAGLMWNNQSWGYWSYPFVPLVSKLKWLEPRHLVNVCNRWARDHTDDLQFAFFNGAGFETWENIWGIWNGLTPRDAETVRRIAKIERSFADLLVSPEWRPYVPALHYGVFATRFPRGGATVWTIVNRNEYALTGEQMRVTHAGGRRFFDLWHGVELKPPVVDGSAVLSFDMEARGYGAVLALDAGADWPDLAAMLAQMRQWAQKPLASFSAEWKPLPQRLIEIARTRPANEVPQGMVRIPGADFDFDVHGVEIEGFNFAGIDVQYPWEDAPRRMHRARVNIMSFYMDRYPVTNGQFQRFLDATRYHPADDQNFLKDWKDGSFPAGWEHRPVTWVSLEDARAYAAWAGKRLPHEWEWQYAAQGTDGRIYPWGSAWDAAMVPEPAQGRQLTGASDVRAHPRGASPFGVEDLVGNVWQWTDEFVDEHTRAAILKGGGYYQAQGSMWYFPMAYKPTEHGKYLLMAPSKDRAGTLGFRCVVDVQ